METGQDYPKISIREDYPKLLIQREISDWDCYMFGNRPGASGMVYTPEKGRVPNRFVRFMMRICFDCTWIKKKN